MDHNAMTTFETRRQIPWLLLAPALCFLSGCVDRSTEGNTSVYTLSLWILGVAILGGLALIAIGFFTRKNPPRWRAYLPIVFGLALIVVGVPMMRLDRVEVDEDHFTSTHGLPWDRVRHDVRFDQLREIRIEVTETTNRYGTHLNYALICQAKSGPAERVPVGNVMEGAVSQILGIARQKGIPLVGVEELPASMQPRQ
jgi:hypothetical protein